MGLDFYAQYRFHSHLFELRAQVAHSSEKVGYIQEGEKFSFDSQWKLVKTHQEVARGDQPEAFERHVGAFSDVLIGDRGDLHFFQVMEKIPYQGELSGKIENEKGVIAREIRQTSCRIY